MWFRGQPESQRRHTRSKKLGGKTKATNEAAVRRSGCRSALCHPLEGVHISRRCPLSVLAGDRGASVVRGERESSQAPPLRVGHQNHEPNGPTTTTGSADGRGPLWLEPERGRFVAAPQPTTFAHVPAAASNDS